ncbi:MAG: ABC transporter permease [Candidatus Eisenbacteria bacterium]
MDTLIQDLRYAARQLFTHPGFTAAAVCTIALGLGANTAIFSVVNAVLLRPLTFPQPDQLVLVWERNRAGAQLTNVVNPANYLDWHDRATSFTDLAAFTWSATTFTGDAPEIVQGRSVTPSFFHVLGTTPALGRVFTAAEAQLGGPPVLVLSDGLWRRRFGGDSTVVGRAVAVAGGSATVVGVMPRTFQPMPWGAEEYWEPFRLDPNDRTRHGRNAMVIGRLRPGVTRERAQAEMDVITSGLEREHPEFDTGWSANVVSLTDQLVGSARRALLIVLAAVALVLLIACANVGNLMLVRADGRRRELAVRTALGATRWRLVRQWLAESVLLAVLGGAVGLLLAKWGVDLLVSSGPADIPRLTEVALDGRVIAVTAGITLAVGIVAGLPAALGVASSGLASGLRGAGGRTTATVAAGRFRSSLVVAQLSLALILLAGAGLLVRSLHRLAAVNPGFDPADLLTLSVELPAATYPDGPHRSAFFSQLVARVSALPGVSAAGAISFLPMTNGGAATRFTIVGRPAPEPGHWTSADIRIVDPGYLAAMRIPPLRGRGMTAADRADAPAVVVINESMARKFWPNQDPIGAHLQVNWARPDVHPEVIGVVGDVHGSTLDGELRPMIYYPQAQEPSGSMTLVARHTGDAAGLTIAVRSAVRALDRDLPVTDVATMSTRLVRSMSDRRYPMLLLAVFAALAVLLAAVGIYGVLSYAVNQRLREIGVRMALGARRADVMQLIIGGGMRLTLAGVVIGSAGAVLAARTLGGLLYGVTPTDPLTFAAVAGLLSLVALVAIYFPARRATRVDPMTVLRAE